DFDFNFVGSFDNFTYCSIPFVGSLLRSQFWILGCVPFSLTHSFSTLNCNSIKAMSSGYAIELYFDPALENQVLKAWNVLARRQISTQLIEMESRPHITLFSSPSLEPSRLENIVKSFASKQEPLPLSFSSIGCLSNDNNVLFLTPTPTLSLLQFQSQLCDAMKKEGIDIGDDYRQDSWIPYCAVAQDVPRARFCEALCVLRDLKLPVNGYAMDIGLVEFSPVRELFSFVFGNSDFDFNFVGSFDNFTYCSIPFVGSLLRSQFWILGCVPFSLTHSFSTLNCNSIKAMSSGYAIELYFDPALENQVLKAWNVLARRQISTQLIEMESRPHITLFSSPSLEPSRLENIVKSFASKQEPLPLSFSSIGCLSNDNNVLFLTPTPTLSLLQFQSQLCDAMKKEGIDIGDDYRQDSWIPYCAVAQDVPRARFCEALCVLRDLKLPVNGYAMDIGLVEFSPVRELFSFVFGMGKKEMGRQDL
ncbi:hypothetical protein CFP56_027149, partial [Quercus suber]